MQKTITYILLILSLTAYGQELSHMQYGYTYTGASNNDYVTEIYPLFTVSDTLTDNCRFTEIYDSDNAYDIINQYRSVISDTNGIIRVDNNTNLDAGIDTFIFQTTSGNYTDIDTAFIYVKEASKVVKDRFNGVFNCDTMYLYNRGTSSSSTIDMNGVPRRCSEGSELILASYGTGEPFKLDGAGLNPAIYMEGNWIYASGFNIRNSEGLGTSDSGCYDCRISNIELYSNSDNGQLYIYNDTDTAQYSPMRLDVRDIISDSGDVQGIKSQACGIKFENCLCFGNNGNEFAADGISCFDTIRYIMAHGGGYQTGVGIKFNANQSLLQYSTVRNVTSYGIYSYDSIHDSRISRCLSHNAGTFGFYMTCTGSGCDRNIYEYNRSYSATDWPGMSIGRDCDSIIFKGNIAYNNNGANGGNYSVSTVGGETPSKVYFINNIAFDTASVNNGVGIKFNGCTGCYAWNNTLYKDSIVIDAGTVSLANNITWSIYGSTVASDSNLITSSGTHYFDTTGLDFRIKNTASEIIGKGKSIVYISDDYYGVKRSSYYDIGAIKYFGENTRKGEYKIFTRKGQTMILKRKGVLK